MRLAIDVYLDYGFPQPVDVLLQIEVAALPDQKLESQSLVIGSDNPIHAAVGEEGVGQRTWARADGRLTAQYNAVVAIDRPSLDLETLGETPVRRLPGPVVQYLLPSRYCESDRFEPFVRREFEGLRGGALAKALAGWVTDNLVYESGSSAGTTTALHTFAERRGVCRDYAHLLVALARAAEIPARCVAAYAPGVTPADFHAVAELWLEGSWHLVDATGMGSCGDIARIGVGRDATDIAFMTVFGDTQMWEQRVSVTRLD